MLVADRQEMGMRAVRSFAAQTYENAMLLIYDNGNVPFDLDTSELEPLQYNYVREWGSATIGELRNRAISACPGADVIVHLDSDDWSSSQRIAEQVALLTASGAGCGGDSGMLFWGTG